MKEERLGTIHCDKTAKRLSDSEVEDASDDNFLP